MIHSNWVQRHCRRAIPFLSRSSYSSHASHNKYGIRPRSSIDFRSTRLDNALGVHIHQRGLSVISIPFLHPFALFHRYKPNRRGKNWYDH